MFQSPIRPLQWILHVVARAFRRMWVEPMDESPHQFFEGISGEYTAAIDRCVPRYREMLGAILHYLPSGWTPARILELGCGSGNLSELVCRKFSNASLRLVDFSGSLFQQLTVPGDISSGLSFKQESSENRLDARAHETLALPGEGGYREGQISGRPLSQNGGQRTALHCLRAEILPAVP